MHEAARGIPNPAGIGGVVYNSKGELIFVFLDSMVVRDSNEADLLGIRKAFLLWMRYGRVELIIEGDLVNAIRWGWLEERLILVVREIRDLCSGMVMSFHHVRMSANGAVDFPEKVGVEREDFVDLFLRFYAPVFLIFPLCMGFGFFFFFIL